MLYANTCKLISVRIDENINDTNRILFSDVLVELSGKQDTLRPFDSLNEAFHTDLSEVRRCPFDSSS